jgi:hypothetical protein
VPEITADATLGQYAPNDAALPAWLRPIIEQSRELAAREPDLKRSGMTDENTTEKTPEQAQTDALLGEVDRLNAELAKAHAAPLISPEEQQRRHVEELHAIVFGRNGGAAR